MGNYVNKYIYHDNVDERIETDMQSPIDEATPEKDITHTPAVQKILPIDPRSITTGINRTPIEVNCTPVALNKRMISAIPKHLQMKPYLETDIDQVMPYLTPKKATPTLVETVKLKFPDVQNKSVDDNGVNSKKKISSIEKERYEILGLDPRSPAADFDRTPILKPKSMQRFRARYLESLHKHGSYETDVVSAAISYCEMSSQFDVPEIQVLPDLARCLVKSLDLDNVNCGHSLNESNSSDSSQSSRTEIIFTNDEEIIVTDDDKVFSEDSTSKNACTKIDKQEAACVTDDTIKVWRDSLLSNCLEDLDLIESTYVQIVEENASQVPKEEVIITFDDDSVAKDTLSLKMFKSQNDKQRTDCNGKKKKILKSEVKSVADERVFNFNDKNCGNGSTKIRTPLGNRSNNGQIQAVLTKSPQQIFRNKNIVPKLLQENTPPHKKYIAKSKLGSTQWDPDSTVII